MSVNVFVCVSMCVSVYEGGACARACSCVCV